MGDQLYWWYDWSPSLFDPEKGDDVRVLMWEAPQFFRRRMYHRQKLTYIFAAMRRFATWLSEERGLPVDYYRCTDPQADRSVADMLDTLAEEGTQKLVMFEPASKEGELFKDVRKHPDLELEVRETGNFLTSDTLSNEHFADRSSFRFLPFYKDQRRRLNLLLTPEGGPQGGSWSLDEENRSSFDEDVEIPERAACHTPGDEEIIAEVQNDISTLELGIGESAPMWYPISPEAARAWLREFLEARLAKFGTYQDAVKPGEAFGFHAVISPILNVGILHPREIMETADAYYQKHTDRVSLNQIEGFQRQVIGWREYVKGVYDHFGDKQRTMNALECTRSLPRAFWTGETGLAPVDECIGRLLRLGYLHHIERLMIMGNIMLLCEIHPDEVYEWFMSLFVDAYDWVMVPNVYGMSQFADGGAMMTKPYVSSSNYLLKMTEFEDDGYWSKVWDALFWEFIRARREYLSHNARMGLMVNLYDKKSEEDKSSYKRVKEEFLEHLC